MKSILVAAAITLSALSMGCQDQHHTDGTTTTKKNPNMMSSTDVCPHCPGVQTAKADGSCSGGCGMKVTK